MQYLSNLVTYFRYLCEQHPQLLHAETSGQRVFEVRAYEEAFGDFRTAAAEKGYAVRLILPTFAYQGDGNQAAKRYQVGLLVARYYSRREDSKTEVVAAMSDAETVGDAFLARIVADSRNGHPLFHYTADDAGALQVTGDFLDFQGDGAYAGVLYLFEFSTFRGLDAACGVVWADGGLTPF